MPSPRASVACVFSLKTTLIASQTAPRETTGLRNEERRGVDGACDGAMVCAMVRCARERPRILITSNWWPRTIDDRQPTTRWQWEAESEAWTSFDYSILDIFLNRPPCHGDGRVTYLSKNLWLRNSYTIYRVAWLLQRRPWKDVVC